MKTTHSFGIDFITRKCRGNQPRSIIYARINVDGQRREISLKEHIDNSDWMAEKEMVRGRTLEARALNEEIDNVRFKIKSKYRMLKDSEALVTADTVKEAYLGAHTLQKGHKLLELLVYYKQIWKDKLKEGGFKNYKTTVIYIERFLKSKFPSGDIYLSQLSIELATDFEHFVRNHPIKPGDPCLGNGLSKHIQRFKRIINWAVELKWIQVNPVDEYSCPMKKSKRKKLPIGELVALENKSFNIATLEYTRDLFLFSCYTGLAYADCMQLEQRHFEWDTTGVVWCLVYRVKSEELSPIPLLPSAASILKKYQPTALPERKGKIFPDITNQQLNKGLKIIQAVCGITTPLTFHVARHTFAKTIALKNGVPLETVQMMMGHAKITTTQIYADVDEEKIMEDMTGIEGKLNKRREIVMAVEQMQQSYSNPSIHPASVHLTQAGRSSQMPGKNEEAR